MDQLYLPWYYNGKPQLIVYYEYTRDHINLFAIAITVSLYML